MRTVLIIRHYLFRFVDIVFGRTSFFIVLLGWFLIITGALFLLRPERARQKLVGMGYGHLKGWLFIFLFCAAGFILPLVLKQAGALGVGLSLLVCGPLVHLYRCLRKKAFIALTTWFARLPLRSIVFFAYFQIAVGILMLYFHRRVFW